MRKTDYKKNGERGMTLIEVLTAVAILALVTGLIYGSISRSLAARDLADRIEERYSTARIAMDRISRELSMAYLTMHMSYDKRTQTLFKAKSESPVDRVLFSSMAHLRLAPDVHESDLSYIEYYGEYSNDGKGRTRIMRKEKPGLDDKPEEGGVAEVLAEDISGLELRYWDDAQKEWADDWDSTGIEKGNKLPRLVKITLLMLDENGKELKFVTKTRLFMDKPLGF